ncbi:MAG: flap endonuclease-1 [Candidatus Aenigmatarchaeota archaeon]|nr:flap endonuclease-1 [Candidatus Aenigmarchaeota archaeon]
MGVQISSIIPSKEIELTDLSGKKIAIDAFNTIFQFLSIIRDRMTGEPLKDHSGNITSHLSGLFYRTANLIEAGIMPIFVFDGAYPEFKKKTIEERERVREEARKKWEEAVRKGEKAIKYAQAASQMDEKILESSKKILELMGIPWIQAPSEGEAQCSYMCKKNDVFATGSQDADSLLFGSPRLVRNLSISGRKKLPGKEVYIEVKPQLIELQNVLKTLDLTREQLIMIGLLIGTDYNEGIEGIGPKTALKLVREHKTLEKLLTAIEFPAEIDIERVYNFFLNPPVTDEYTIQPKEPNKEKLIKFMVDEHDFAIDRVEKVIDKLKESYNRTKQVDLKGWFGR